VHSLGLAYHQGSVSFPEGVDEVYCPLAVVTNGFLRQCFANRHKLYGPVVFFWIVASVPNGNNTVRDTNHLYRSFS